MTPAPASPTAVVARGPAAHGRPRLFDGADVRVIDARAFGSSACLVTFTSWTDELTLDREGFGEAFLRAEGLDAVHLISRDNRWWQYAETAPALAAVRAAVAGHPRVVTYGSSMGAYAAARLAGEAGAHAALAMSPQFSILPQAAPFEHRWAAAARALRPVWELEPCAPWPAETYLLHDPFDLDARHVALFARTGRPVVPVRLRHAGHQTAGFLQEAGLLQAVVREAAAGPLDVAALEREAWRRRRRSPQHLLTLAERVHEPLLRLALTERALRLAPQSAPLHSRLGDALRTAGRLGEALDAHAHALALQPGTAPLVRAWSTTLLAAGRTEEAREALRDLARSTGDAAHLEALEELDGGGPAQRRGARRARPRDPGVRPPPGAAPVPVAADEVGCVLCGPLLMLRRGRYAVTFGVAPAADVPRRLLRDGFAAAAVDVLGAGVRLAHRVLSTRDLRRAGGRITLTFDLPDAGVCEFRVFARGRIALVVSPERPCRRVGRLA